MSHRRAIRALSYPALSEVKGPETGSYINPPLESCKSYSDVISDLIEVASFDQTSCAKTVACAVDFIKTVRKSAKPTMMEAFLAEYGLSTQEGVALMTLAEALLRTPDTTTIDELINDKLSVGAWERHTGKSKSALVNSATWGLLITGKVLTKPQENGIIPIMRQMVRRLGEPVIRSAVETAMRQLGKQFVLGTTIDDALKKAAHDVKNGYSFSFDMLGEAARTNADAIAYFKAYKDAIITLSPHCTMKNIESNPGISVKLSALHARYESTQHDRVMTELLPRIKDLALLAAQNNMGLNIDGEEQDRLDISLDIIEALIADPDLTGWDGFGVVVQAYGPRALPVIDFLHHLAVTHDRRIMVRLVKGAYWDTEIKRAQVMGLSGFPVFTRKAHSDISYIACARRLLEYKDRIYSQFATHNAHTVSAILTLGREDTDSFEFQRLHGMGESLHQVVKKKIKSRCRIYAPVGSHKDLLAYLVRRLLENGANSSFVNQIVDASRSPEEIAICPFGFLADITERGPNPRIAAPIDIFRPDRPNSHGFDWSDPIDRDRLLSEIACYTDKTWIAAPSGTQDHNREEISIFNPADPSDCVGTVWEATKSDVFEALDRAEKALVEWSSHPIEERASIFNKVADLMEIHWAELFSILIREAGKSIPDAIAELREAVDFLRYYAHESFALHNSQARGIFACISPWNFPLAIFTGQIAAALVTGNAVMAKPAEQTPLIAAKAVSLFLEAGIPHDILALLPGKGGVIGAAMTSDPRVAGVCFTGSTGTAHLIHRSIAKQGNAMAPLIAETGGLNAMIVDSSALPEQATRDIIASSFQSAGQRCSAVRILYLQEDIADHVITMLKGAMDELVIGNPALLKTDVGPVIDIKARDQLVSYCKRMEAKGRLLKKVPAPNKGYFVAPHLIKVSGIEEMDREMFGPILHIATFAAKDFEKIIEDINAKGYGLTLGLHSRIETRVNKVIDRAHIGNIYINRNQIGAVVGSQPFGGEGLSGTGPKAGGPLYLRRFVETLDGTPVDQIPLYTNPVKTLETLAPVEINEILTEIQNISKYHGEEAITAMTQLVADNPMGARALNAALPILAGQMTLPGPTGESNRWSLHPRGVILLAGSDREGLLSQLVQALLLNNKVVIIAPFALELVAPFEDAGWPAKGLDGLLEPADLEFLDPLDGLAWSGEMDDLRALRSALAARDGAIIPLITRAISPERYVSERHLCIDTTAAGGNATLLAVAEV